MKIFAGKRLLLLVLAAAGCGAPPVFPTMHLDKLDILQDPTLMVAVPDESNLTDRSVRGELLNEHRPRSYPRVDWKPAPSDGFDVEAAKSISLVRTNIDKCLNPYAKGQMDLFSRIIVSTADGKYFYTRRLGDQTRSVALSEKYIDDTLFTFASANGTLTPAGRLIVEPQDPVEAAKTGYRAKVSLNGTELVEEVVVPPSFTSLTSLDYSGNAGATGIYESRGAHGGDGTRGNDGARGQNGSDGRSYSEDGRDGGSGSRGTGGSSGGNGRPAGHAGRGQDGSPAGEITVRVKPLQSMFTSKPLVHVSITSKQSTRSYVIEWGQKLLIDARGGDGGSGGRGGDGGDGGDGGRGGYGGTGGQGGDGAAGRPGTPGRKGTNATADSDAGRGTAGSGGGPGGNGGNGGSGGDAGNGGAGGNGGDGGSGGNGGNGGRGATVVVSIEGDEEFIAAAKASISFNVSGGRPGLPGEGGRGGFPGSGGEGGQAGRGGWAGKGGKGGAGGAGGPGGDGITYMRTIYPQGPENPPVKIPATRPRGEDGPRGPDGTTGRSGRQGADGTWGRKGADGNSGNNGVPGAPGSAGPDGTVKWSETVEKYDVVCEIRAVRVSDGTLVAGASGRSTFNRLDSLARELSESLRAQFHVQGEPIALAGLRNRTGTANGEAVVSELADKLTVHLVETKWFEVRERIDLAPLMDERDLERAEIVREFNLHEKLGEVKYIIIGGVTAQ